MKILDQISELVSLKIKEIAKRSDERHLGDGFNLERLDRILQRIYLHDRMSDGDFKELQMLGFLRGVWLKVPTYSSFKIGQKVFFHDLETEVTNIRFDEDHKVWQICTKMNSNWLAEGFYK